jgi:ABC-2 type transport system ATP-binding protein
VQNEAIFEIHVDSLHPLESGTFTSIERVNSVHFHPEDSHTVMELYLQEESAVAQVFAALALHSARVLSLQKREPTLEDVFVKLVGARIEEVENADAPAD